MHQKKHTQASSNFSASDQNISQSALPYCCEDHFVSAYHVTPSVALSNSQDILGEVSQEIMSQMLCNPQSSDTKRKQQFGLQRSVCKAAVEHASPEEFPVAVTASVFSGEKKLNLGDLRLKRLKRLNLQCILRWKQFLLPKHQGCKGNVHQLDLQEGGVCPGAIGRILIQKKVLNAFSPHKTKR